MGDRRHFERDIERRLAVERRIERSGIVTVGIRLAQGEVMRRGDVDRAQPAGEPAPLGTRRVDMAGAGAIAELGHGIAALGAAAPETQEDIVVAVED